MKINRNKSIEEWAIEEVQNNWGSEEREGIHLSDLLVPRQKYMSHFFPKKATIKEISYWTSGNVIERKFLNAIGYKKGETREWNGIKYSPDVFFNFPSEIKSRRGWLAKEGEEERVYEWYLKQLKGYCAIGNSIKGWLIVMSLIEKKEDGTTAPEWGYYDVEFTKEELDQEKFRLVLIRDQLEDAIKNKDFSKLPECPPWMCGKTSSVMTQKPYCETCQKEFETDWGINKHINSKTGSGHIIRVSIYVKHYEKRCKWYDECKGENHGNNL